MKSPLNRAPALLPAIILIGALLITGCRGRHSRAEIRNEEPAAGLGIASALKMSDQAANIQLLKGFHAVEGGAWRWTAGKFKVLLRPPAGSAQAGTTLSFAFSIPDVVIQKLHSLSLSASIGGKKLKTETYSKAGAYTFSAPVPSSLLADDSVTIDFECDKSLPAGSVDQRELALIATSIGFENK